jgi:hypothetical protein
MILNRTRPLYGKYRINIIWYSINKKITAIYLLLPLTVFSFGIASAFENELNIPEKSETSELYDNGENYGSDWS